MKSTAWTDNLLFEQGTLSREYQSYNECPFRDVHRDEYYSLALWSSLTGPGWMWYESWDADVHNEGEAPLDPFDQNILYPWGWCHGTFITPRSQDGFAWNDEYTYSRNVQIELVTGGFQGQTHFNNLFQLSVSARAGTEDTDPMIPPEEITVWGKTLDPQGRVYGTYPDHTTVPSTPVTAGDCVTYWAEVIKAKLIITRGVGGPDITHLTGIPVWVGERVDLACSLSPPIAEITSYSWTIAFQNHLVKGYEADDQAGDVIEFPLQELNNPSLWFYWKAGQGAALVRCTVQVAGETVTTEATFELKRPNAPLIAEVLSNVTVDTAWLETPGQPALHLGSPDTTKGIKFTYTPDVLGSYQFVQIGRDSRMFLHANGQWYGAIGEGLDTFYPYPNEGPRETSDSPGWGLRHVDHIVAADFEMHLMFRPPAVQSIWVPLRKVSWDWYGYVGWVESANEWQLFSDPEDRSAGAVMDSTEHPEWTSNLHEAIDEYEDYEPL